MRGYTCATCGGDLSPYGARDLFYCNFCGKLYSENKEVTPAEASRKLRMQNEFQAARLLMEEHMAKEGESCICLRELLLSDLNESSICGYIEHHLDDMRLLKGLETNKLYRRFRNLAGDDEELSIFCEQLESFRKIYDYIEKYQEELGKTRVNIKLADDDIKKTYNRKTGKYVDRVGGYICITLYIWFWTFVGMFLIPNISFGPALLLSMLIAVGFYLVIKYVTEKPFREEKYKVLKHYQMMESAIDEAKWKLSERVLKLKKFEKELFEEENDS